MSTLQQFQAKHRGANITRITDDLFIGGDLSALKEKRELQILGIIEAGITHIIDMRMEDDDTDLWAEYGVEYINLGTNDAVGHHIPAELFDTAVRFARDAAKSGGKVLAHCHMGVNRGPSAGYAIMLDRGFGPSEAFDLIRERRPQAAVWYAEDALVAHLARRNVRGWFAKKRMARFLAHRDAVFTKAEQAKTVHYIRGQHKTDAEERQMMRAEEYDRIMARQPGTRWSRPTQYRDRLQEALDSLDPVDFEDDDLETIPF